MSIKLVAEIGINHNGDIDIAKKLIDLAHSSGFDYVKFQKRDVDLCIPEAKKAERRQTPWGEMSYYDYKKKIEFNLDDYREIGMYCIGKVQFFFSVWDMPSAEFAKIFSTIVKIPSACLTNDELIEYCRGNFETVILSTGMSTEEQIEHAVEIGDPDIILHCHSGYPAPYDELNLSYIKWLESKYTNREIGYSGHECGIASSIAAASIGAKWIERHITLNKNMWGSDHCASIGPTECFRLSWAVREIEKSVGEAGERKILESEKSKLSDLRK